MKFLIVYIRLLKMSNNWNRINDSDLDNDFNLNFINVLVLNINES